MLHGVLRSRADEFDRGLGITRKPHPKAQRTKLNQEERIQKNKEERREKDLFGVRRCARSVLLKHAYT